MHDSTSDHAIRNDVLEALLPLWRTRHEPPGTPKATDPAATDPRFPFPHTAQQTRCQRTPQTFDFANGDHVAGGAMTEQRIEAARAAYARCPLVADCLL